MRAEVGERGKGRRKRGDVAADRWGRIDSGTGAGTRWPAGSTARGWAAPGPKAETGRMRGWRPGFLFL
jgi:hypothetical protein